MSSAQAEGYVRFNATLRNEVRDWISRVADSAEFPLPRMVLEQSILVAQLVAAGVDPRDVPAVGLLLEAAAGDELTKAVARKYKDRRQL